MIKKYILRAVTVDESAKEDIKELMGWSEEEFRGNTKEMYEDDKQTLSDKIDDVNFIANPKLDVGLVKRALNDFIYQYLLFGWKDLCPHNKENVKKKAKEIFGEKLIE